ncbi:MAG: 16S rRNA (adenine(1518)-N(6)/adenine(1519)-N(6))-dimethyltransferase RsmA [Lachnospiraceae bacterium]|nr:16S rRNA (adenine(1518)-N(6)/adenine(1519)-N(6))-dimethyltransferase RsmA [Lachnospiraceae bacterium]
MADLGRPTKTVEIIQKYNFNFRKKFGQNFLIDEGILEKIVSAAEVTKDDVVLEIGPGIGSMTQYLAEAAGKVIAVEIDDQLIPILKETLSPYDNVTVIHGDVMKTDLKKLSEEYGDGKPFKVVANLPYYITTPIIMRLLEDDVPTKRITVMVQKEVAERIKEKPGSKEYGAISLSVQYYAKPEIACIVPPNCFMPRPNVDSAVLNLDPYETAPVSVKNPKFMFQIIRASFNQRRKTLANGIAGGGLGIDRLTVEEVLESLGMPKTVRGETLGLTEFAKIADALKEH